VSDTTHPYRALTEWPICGVWPFGLELCALHRQLVEVTDAEPVVLPFLVENRSEALPDRSSGCVRRPPVVVRDRRDPCELLGRDIAKPGLDLERLLVSDGAHLGQCRTGRRVEINDNRWPQPYWCERLGHSENTTPKPRVVHEHEVTQGLNHRPLAIDTGVLTAFGHGLDPFDCRGPVVVQLPPTFSQVRRILGSEKDSDRITAVEFCLDVRRDFDPVNNEIGNEAIDLDVFHDDAHKT
jgi:hypothetical protein